MWKAARSLTVFVPGSCWNNSVLVLEVKCREFRVLAVAITDEDLLNLPSTVDHFVSDNWIGEATAGCGGPQHVGRAACRESFSFCWQLAAWQCRNLVRELLGSFLTFKISSLVRLCRQFRSCCWLTKVNLTLISCSQYLLQLDALLKPGRSVTWVHYVTVSQARQ